MARQLGRQGLRGCPAGQRILCFFFHTPVCYADHLLVFRVFFLSAAHFVHWGVVRAGLLVSRLVVFPFSLGHWHVERVFRALGFEVLAPGCMRYVLQYPLGFISVI